MNEQKTEQEKGRTANISLAKKRVKCFYETFVQGSSSVNLFNICDKSPLLRQAENRWQKTNTKTSPKVQTAQW